MQFRKVCNHPELFERRSVRAPLLWQTPHEPSVQQAFGKPTLVWSTGANPFSNPIQLCYPRLVHHSRRVDVSSDPSCLHPADGNDHGSRFKLLANTLSLWHSAHIHRDLFGRLGDDDDCAGEGVGRRPAMRCRSAFSFTRFFDVSPAELGRATPTPLPSPRS